MAEADATTDTPKGRTVLIAMDGSKHSTHAFEWYAQHLHREDDNVLMAYCAEIGLHLPSTAYLGSPATIHAMMQEHEGHVKEVLKTIDHVAKKYNIKHTLERLDTPHHKPGESIVKAADQQNVNLIILGSRGQGAIRRTIMGSTSDYVLHHSHVPVVVCKHEDEHHKLK